MLGLLLTLALANTAPPAMPSASVTCPGWPASCDGAWANGVDGAADAQNEDDSPREYATPVEVDCPTPPDATAPTASSECDEPTLNLWYRVSRNPDSEVPAGSLAPAPHRARVNHGMSAGGAPDPGHLSIPDVQPAALCALPGLALTDARDHAALTTRTIIARAIAPPDRPPRA